MKVQRKELNVFSISALDLFASGMGAFVLLTLMAMPFFPNISTKVETDPNDAAEAKQELEASQQRVQDLEQMVARLQQTSDVEQAIAAELDEAQQQVRALEQQVQDLQRQGAQQQADESRVEELERQLQAAQERQNALEEAQKSIKLPHVDLVICLDVTASMRAQIAGLKREIASLAAVLDKLSPSVGIGVVAFGDRKWRRPLLELPITPTTSLTRIEAFINRLEPNMGDSNNGLVNNDGPEAVAQAMAAAAAMRWRSESERRYIIAITDNPAYPDRRQAAIATARQFSGRDNHYVSTVRANISGGPNEPVEAMRFLKEVASVGNGNFVDAAGGESMLSTVLLAILGT